MTTNDLTIRADADARTAAGDLAKSAKAKGYRPEALHTYSRPDGSPWFWRIRAKHQDGRKWIRPMRLNGAHFEIGEPDFDGDKPLYNLSLLATHPESVVWLVEGEKAADALTRVGRVAITSGAADSAESADWQPLAGREVIVWPDNDDAGLRYLTTVLRLLWKAGASRVRLVDLPALELAEKGDAFDWLETHNDLDALPLTDIERPAEEPNETALEPLRYVLAQAPYPLDALPTGMAAAVREVADYVQAPLALVAQSALSAATVAVQGLADVARDEKLLSPSSLFLLTIADSGERKTTCDSYFMTPLRQWADQQRETMQADVESFRAELAAWHARRTGLSKAIEEAEKKADADRRDEAIAALRDLEGQRLPPPRVPKLEVGSGDFSFEAIAASLHEGWPSALLASAEAGTFFGGRATQSETLMRLLAMMNLSWDGKPYEVSRRSSDNSFVVSGRRLSVSLMVQAPTLADFMRKNGELARGTGFLARFLVARPISAIGSRTYQPPPSSWPALTVFQRRLRALIETPLHMDADTGSLSPTLLAMSPGAFAVWRDFYDRVEIELGSSGLFADLRDAGSKCAENAARLAAVFHCIEVGPHGAIQSDTIRRACRLAVWHLAEAKALIADSNADPRLLAAERLEEWLIAEGAVNKGAVSTRRISQFGPYGLRNKDTRDAAIALLEQAGRITVITQGRGRMVALHPALLSGTTRQEERTDARLLALLSPATAALHSGEVEMPVHATAATPATHSSDPTARAATVAGVAGTTDLQPESLTDEIAEWVASFEAGEELL